jgi:hypothetical protein
MSSTSTTQNEFVLLFTGHLLDSVDRPEQRSFVPVFGQLDAHTTRFQSRWKKRLKITLIILATVAFFDAFVTVSDHFLAGNGQMVSLLFSVAGAFLSL